MTQHTKRRYRTKNWKQYNAALKSRCSLTVWLDKHMCWFAAASGKRVRSPKFSNAAIQFCLTLKNLFGLALDLCKNRWVNTKRVMARGFESQVNELHIRAAILNRFTELGRPQTAGFGVAHPKFSLCNSAQ